MKKYKKYIALLLIVVTIFGIYHFFKTDKINYIALGDSLAQGMNPYGEVGYSYTDYFSDYLKENNQLSYYTKKYTKSSYTTVDLKDELVSNNLLKKDLRESDLVTVSIGANDLLNSINIKTLNINDILNLKSVVDEIIPNLDTCLKEIRKYAKEDMIIIGYYNPIPFLFNTSGNDLDTLFAYIDEEYRKLSDKYDCKYISIYQLFKINSSYLPNSSDMHPNLKGYEAISNELIKKYKDNNKNNTD